MVTKKLSVWELVNPITKEQKEWGIKHNGVRCPLCHSDNAKVEYQHFGIHKGKAFAAQERTCGACGREWSSVYILCDIHDLD